MQLTPQRVALFNNVCLSVVQLVLIVAMGFCVCGMIGVPGITALITQYWMTYLAVFGLALGLTYAAHRWIAKQGLLQQFQRYERVK